MRVHRRLAVAVATLVVAGFAVVPTATAAPLPTGSTTYKVVRVIDGDTVKLSNGTTVRDYRTGTGEQGNFQLGLLVYGREGEPCRRCGTRLAGTHTIDARITVFCHRCQS